MGGDSEKGSPAVAAPRPDLATTLLQLALRCEREEPSRKLDCHIALLLCDDERCREWYRGFLSIPSDREILYPYGKSIALYTTSLDAAVTLVPEGWIPADIYCNTKATTFTLLRPGCDHDGTRTETQGVARSEAMARCAAALRARAAMATDEPAARTSDMRTAEKD